MELLLIPYMSLIYRMRGGYGISFPRPIEQFLYALPYAVVVWLFTSSYLITLIAATLTTITVLKGHGHNMDLGSWKKPADYEWYEIHKSLHGKISEYWYDVIGIGLSGLTYTIPSGICTLNPLLCISGLLKAPAYMISWKFTNSTELGEWLTGAFAGLSLVIIYALYL